MSANAVKAYADQADRCVEMQIRIIEDKNREIATLKRRIEDLNDAVISGKAIIPDAQPYYQMPESFASYFCRQYKAETGRDAIGHLSAKDMWELTSSLSKKNGGNTTWEEFCAQRSEDIKNLTR
jgi:hypothetical protein